MISKFKDVLVNEELEPERTRDALKTLNEQVHHQVSGSDGSRREEANCLTEGVCSRRCRKRQT